MKSFRHGFWVKETTAPAKNDLITKQLPNDNPVPLVDRVPENILSQLDLVVAELLLGGGKVLLEALDELEALPDVGLEAAVLQRTADYLLLGVLLQGEGVAAQFVGTSIKGRKKIRK